jgi:glycosyltransferase involved in cell wall biosynthesis
VQDPNLIELIVVDQNNSSIVKDMIKFYEEHFKIIYIKSDRLGLSFNRNLGISNCSSKYIAFPDDDCWYPPRLLSNVLQNLESCDGISCRITDENNLESVLQWSKSEELVAFDNFWTTSCSASIFLRIDSLSEVVFDERLGVGAQNGLHSGEETDFLLKLLKKNFKIIYKPTLHLYHPQQTTTFSITTLKKLYRYGKGFGFMLDQNELPFMIKCRFYYRPIGGVLKFLVRDAKKSMLYLSTTLGRISGLILSKRQKVKKLI